MAPDVCSSFIDINGPIHVADFGGPDGAPPIVLVHGLAGSHQVWAPLAALLGERYRVLALDLPGHGRSPLAGRSAAVADAAAVLVQSLDRLGLPPVTLVGHSMGAAASVLAGAASPGAVARLALLGAPVPRPGLGVIAPALLPHVAMCMFPPAGRRAVRRRITRRGVAEHVEAGLRLSCSSLDGLGETTAALAKELEAGLAAGEDPAAVFVEAARSMGFLLARGRAYRDAIAAAPSGTLVLHGAQDRVVSVAAAESARGLRPDWSVCVLDGVGHSPHLEAPRLVAERIGGLEELAPHGTGATPSRMIAALSVSVEREASDATGAVVA